MIQLCFSDSVKGALQMATHCGKGRVGAVSIALIGGSGTQEEQEIRRYRLAKEERERQSVPLEGEPADVLSLPFALSMGDIRPPFDVSNSTRRQLLTNCFFDDPWDELEEKEKYARQFWERGLCDWEELQKRARQGEEVRLWVDNTPDDLCGLLFASVFLSSLDRVIRVVPLPPYRQTANGTVVQHAGWGELSPEEFGHFLVYEREVTPKVLRVLAQRWKELEEENKPLRAMVNGRLVGVEEDFYDGFILRQASAEPCRVGELIGRVLGRERLGISDWLVARRIRSLAERGKLNLVEEDPRRFYQSRVCRGG